MSIAIAAIGLPGSGKTTVLKPLAERFEYAYINRDDIRAELWGDATDQSRNKEVWEEANRRTREAITIGKGVILDSTFVELWKRQDMIAFLRTAGATKVIGVYADISLSLAKERNSMRSRVVSEAIIEWMHRELIKNPPSIEDGFDAFYRFSELPLLEKELLATNVLPNPPAH